MITTSLRQTTSDLLLYLTAGIVSLFVVPVYMVSVTPEEFSFLNSGTFLAISTVMLVFAMLLATLLTLLLHLLRLSTCSRVLSVFILCWLTLAGLMFPLVRSDGMVDASETQLLWLNVALVLTISTVLTALALTKLKGVSAAFLAVVVLSSISTSLGDFLHVVADDSDKLTEDIAKLSPTRNIIVLSFDGTPGTVTREVLEQHPTLASAFSDFVFYSNTVSQAPATDASIRSELFGNRNYHNYGDTASEVYAALDFEETLINKIEDSFTYHNSYGRFNLNPQTRLQRSELAGGSFIEYFSEHEYWYSLIFSRLGTGLLSSLAHRTNVIDFTKNILEGDVSTDDDFPERLENHQGPNWKPQHFAALRDFNWLVERLETNEKSDFSIRMMHFTHTHFPVDFDRDCNFKSDDPVWYQENQNYQGLYEQTICILGQFQRFIEKLQSLGVYDNSLIVIKSDHGEPVNYYNRFPNDIRINNHSLWGLDRYLPLLMIKDFGSSSESLHFREDMVTLADLAPTLCRHSGLPNLACNDFPGIDLLSGDTADPNDRIYIEIVRNRSSNFAFDSHRTVALERDGRPLHELLTDAGVALHSPSGKDSRPEMIALRINALDRLKKALDSYHNDHGHYPESIGWDGRHTDWGESTENWIANLSPTYISELPRDPRMNDAPDQQYLYRSNGSEYKVIAHSIRRDCDWIMENRPDLVDPARNCWAYGYWTDGAREW